MTGPGGRLGDWELLGELGRGGMAVVYAARHAPTGALAAVKTSRSGSGSQLEVLRREIASLARLRHPNIVRILDHGVDGDRPWYAMEWLEGRRLDEVTQSRTSSSDTGAHASTFGLSHFDPALAKATPEPAVRRDVIEPATLRTVLAVIHRLCAPLAWLHGEGLVHRDLKPANVLVRGDGQPILVDFGLAWSFAPDGGREALDVRGSKAGTPTYMAPEQIRGERLDARADLYALGCILYELIAGRPPFVGSGRLVVQQHLHERPIPLSERLDGVPSALDDLVMRLLAKPVDRRVGYAVDVARELETLADLPPDDGPPPRPYVYRPRLLGRGPLFAELERAADEAEGVRLIGGESGVGKTRLVSTVARRAADRGARVLAGECPDGGALPLQGLRGPLAALRRFEGPLPDVLSPYLGDDGAGAGDEGGRERQRVHAALVAVLRRAAAGKRLLVVIDDVQWADPLTVEALAHLARARVPGLLVLATHRVEEGQALLAPLRAVPEVVRTSVERLSTEEAAGMVRDMLAIATDAPVARRVVLASEGNPLHVVELVRWAVEAGSLARGADGTWATVHEGRLGLPPSLAELMARRLAALPAHARRLATAAAVLGRAAPLAHLAAVADLSPDELDAGIAELVRQHVAEVYSASLRFGHDQLRAAALAAVPPEARAPLHARAAVALHATAAPPLGRVARHEELGGVGDPASTYFRAARRAARAHATSDAARLARSALRLADRPALRAEAALLLGSQLGHGAHVDAALQALGHAVVAANVAGREDLAMAALAHRGALELRAFRPAVAARTFRALRRRARALGDRSGEAEAEIGLGMVAIQDGRSDRAEARQHRALAMLSPKGEPQLVIQALQGLATAANRQERSAEAVDILRAAERLARGGPRHAEVLSHLAWVLFHLGRLEEARIAATGGAASAGRLGYLREEALARALVGLLAELDGDTEIAERQTRRAAVLNRTIGAWNDESLNLVNLATNVAGQGRVGEARTLFEQAVRAIGDRRFPRGQAILTVQRTTLERRLGADPAALLPDVVAAAETLEGLRDAIGAAMAWCEAGHLRLALGEPADRELAAAEANAARAGQHAATFAGKGLDRLRRAIAAEALLAGEHPDDVPVGLRHHTRA